MTTRGTGRRAVSAAVMAGLALVLVSGTSATRSTSPATTSAPKPNSVLARLALSMPPGTWALLNKDGDDSGYGLKFTESGVGTVYGYASKAVYDPARRRVFFFASGHHQVSTPEAYAEMMKFIVYEVDKNRWTRLKTPQWYLDTGTKGGNSHGYQYQALAPGRFFRASLGPPARKGILQVCNIDREDVLAIDPVKDWDEGVSPPFEYSVGPFEYFPERKSLMTVNTRTSEVYELVLGSQAWVKRDRCEGLTGYGIAASYNRAHKVVVFGGGALAGPPWTKNRTWYILDAEGKVSRLDDSPVDSYAATSTLFTMDPVSGKHLLIRPTDFDYKTTTGFWFYELDLTRKPGGQWSRRQDLEASVPQFYARSPNHVFATVVVPLPEYGVNMFMAPGNVWLYRHFDAPAGGR
jgi:hypothetical protein